MLFVPACIQVAYMRLPTPPNPWRQAAAKQAQQEQPDKDQDKQQQEQQEGDSTPVSQDTRQPAQQQQGKDTQKQQGQEQAMLSASGQQLTSKQRRQLKRRQELAARAAERDSLVIARAACAALIDKKLSLQQKPLTFDPTMEQVSDRSRRGWCLLEGGCPSVTGSIDTASSVTAAAKWLNRLPHPVCCMGADATCALPQHSHSVNLEVLDWPVFFTQCWACLHYGTC
jgi:hypothetical protein